MNIFQRITKLVEANVNSMLDKAEDPEVMVRQIIREMEESIIELRRETVKAVGARKLLEKKMQLLNEKSADLQQKATLALENGNEDLARKLLEQKIDVEKENSQLANEVETATYLAEKMKQDLVKLEDQVQIARRQKEELIRRKLAAERKMNATGAIRKTRDALEALTGATNSADANINAIEAQKDKILQLEAEAEAMEELMEGKSADAESEKELEKMIQNKAVEDELAKLKKMLSDGKKK
ncbi:MAG: PspA/IM30 family protein [Calditrichaeota bacterium]|nr:PspA/IM30 family protein [Calditrichota bacterium]MCB0269130.1 PspA/IM30 family protein [Calditrichota bacterium]MCB0288055.1 PspA/IM30 family protein [Calditrichota bacterium]MCB0302000.1 PspA/IM30 family protein [Calditrichota bacterium]MCB9066434.1 PspA/IM30 family protein [Calditrichia bacterium]